MNASRLRRLAADRRGYVMLVAMLFIAILAVVGASSLQVAGIDQRIALQNRKHMLVVNTSHAGTEHARTRVTGYCRLGHPERRTPAACRNRSPAPARPD